MSAPGRATPAASRVPELENVEWLRERLERVGQATIAGELGVSRWAVRQAIKSHGLTARVGRRRGASSPRLTSARPHSGERGELEGSLAALTFHFAEDHRHKSPPSREMLIARCQGWLDADRHHDHEASQHALLSMASGALLVHEHHAKLREAA